VLLAEGSKPILLRDQTGISIPVGTASVAGRKYSLVATQALLLTAVALLGAGPLARLGATTPGGATTLRLVIAGGAVVLAASAAVSGRAFAAGAVADKVRRVLARLPILGSRIGRHQRAFTEADAAAESYFRRPLRQRAARAFPFFVAWCVESFETWCFLRVVGVELDLWSAFCLEVPLGLLRSIAFFTPAGVGIQDLGYATALAAFGVPDAGAAALAFTLLKRCKEMLWVGAGYLLLAMSRQRVFADAAAQSPSASSRLVLRSSRDATV
jgi:glycosyltransferase 2 family protein